MKLFQALLFLMPPPSWLLFSDRLSFRWVQAQQECDLAKTKFDPFIHKSTYTIGVHATLDLETVFDETNQVFGEYLTATAGKRFDPPIQFNVVPNYFDGIFDAIENEEVDFLYSDPGVYSCIGTQVGATALATVVRKLSVRGRSFDLDVYGGVIAVRHDNDEINTIGDLKDKIIGAGAITDLMGGQMQINELERAGMSYVNDPKQVVFAKSQLDVVRGVISGRFDVGFVRTDQIELTTDQNGDLVDPDLFKIIEPKIYVMDSGELFPFLHSTDIYPEWPFAALPGVPADVQRAVQEALMDFGEHARIGQSLQECYSGKNESQWCDELGLNDVIPNAPCNSTKELSLLAVEGREKSDITRFRTASSYFDLRTMQQRAGFLIQDETMKWHCTRPTKIFEGITCPEGYYKRDETEFLEGCAHIGLSCDDNPEYDCFCKPCVKAHEVDVYYLDIGENDPHLEKFYGYSLPGCQKMSICGTIEQGDSITLRIFDNMHRQGANVTVEIHAGTTRKTVHARNIAGTDAYEFTLSDDTVQAQVIDILINGIAISQSPIRVMVVSADCKAEYGVGSHRVSDSEGRCVCAGHTYEMGSTCVESAFFFLIIFTAVFLAVGVLVFFYLGYKKKQSDSVWHIGVDDLHFNEPPEVIGQGGFGVVILGQYRGTKVAVKRVLPPSKVSKGNSSSIISEKDIGYQSTVATGTSHSDCRPKLHETKDGNRIVKFGSVTNSGDIESQIRSTNGTKELQSSSYSGSNKDWERLLEMRYSDHDVLKLLESATSSDHGSGLCSRGSISKSTVVLRYLPLCLRFDKHSRRVADFVNEMRMLSRLRHPCITTVMGAVISTSLDPMLGESTLLHLH